jgi:hypothetical protein
MTDNVDRAKLFAKLRQSTQAMLGIEKPTPEQQLKIDLAASLRLEIDRIIAAQLAGQPADVRELTTLNESLRSRCRSARGTFSSPRRRARTPPRSKSGASDGFAKSVVNDRYAR